VKKNAVILLLMLCMSALCGCRADFDPAALLQGNLDLVYHNQYTDPFLKATGMTEEAAAQRYADGIEAEMGYFAEAFGIDLSLCGEDVKEELRDVCRQICGHTKYKMGETEETGGGYRVTLTVWPVDIIRQVRETDGTAFTEAWTARYNKGEFDAMTGQQYEEAWARGVLGLFRDRLENVGYQEPETVTVEIIKGEEQGQYVIAAEDLARVDTLVLAY